MNLRSRRFPVPLACAAFGSLLLPVGCGGGRPFVAAPAPLSVMLVNPKVVVRQGAATVEPVRVIAPTEAVLLRLDFMPAGVTGAYSAPENNPSGSLQFVATRTALTGVYAPRVTVTSEGREASMIFSLEVDAGAKP